MWCCCTAPLTQHNRLCLTRRRHLSRRHLTRRAWAQAHTRQAAQHIESAAGRTVLLAEQTGIESVAETPCSSKGLASRVQSTQTLHMRAL